MHTRAHALTHIHTSEEGGGGETREATEGKAIKVAHRKPDPAAILSICTLGGVETKHRLQNDATEKQTCYSSRAH